MSSLTKKIRTALDSLSDKRAFWGYGFVMAKNQKKLKNSLPARTNDSSIVTKPDSGSAKIPRKQVWAWAFWDWATQPFNTVLITFVWVPSFLTSAFFLDPNVVGTDSEESALGQLASNLGYQ